MPARKLPTIIVAATLLAGCTDAVSTSADRFTQTGELIAVSGGAAGAANACFTCHGIEGRGNGAGSPRLAGLDAGYLERQLIAYADGRRQQPQMRWIAKQLSADERKAVALHYARMRFEPVAGTAPPLELYHRGDPSRGLPACASCHGDSGEGVGPANPPLAGQPAPYLAEQLALWRAGKRRSDPGNVMLRISQLLTPSESRLLSDYAAGLSGGPPSPGRQAASPSARHAYPRSDALGPPLHVPESARAAE